MLLGRQNLTNWLRTHSFSQLSAGQYGGTFVDWSINYLCNIKSHTLVELNGYSDSAIPDNPIATTGSAHQHNKNCSGNIGQIYWQWHFLYTHRPEHFHTFYMHMPNPWVNNFDQSPHDMVNFKEYMDSYSDFVIDVFSQQPTIPCITVYPDFDTASWVWLRRYRTTKSISTFSDFNKENTLAPFAADQTLSREEIREKLALCSIPFNIVQQHISINQIKIKNSLPNCLSVSLTEIFNDLEKVLKEIQFRHPGLNFDQTKWSNWRNIYELWRSQNIEELNWCKQLDNIINKIINKEQCLTNGLTDPQELIIETELLLKGYSIKNFNLKHFPLDLSCLQLEPTIHHKYISNLT